MLSEVDRTVPYNQAGQKTRPAIRRGGWKVQPVLIVVIYNPLEG